MLEKAVGEELRPQKTDQKQNESKWELFGPLPSPFRRRMIPLLRGESAQPNQNHKSQKAPYLVFFLFLYFLLFSVLWVVLLLAHAGRCTLITLQCTAASSSGDLYLSIPNIYGLFIWYAVKNRCQSTTARRLREEKKKNQSITGRAARVANTNREPSGFPSVMRSQRGKKNLAGSACEDYQGVTTDWRKLKRKGHLAFHALLNEVIGLMPL